MRFVLLVLAGCTGPSLDDRPVYTPLVDAAAVASVDLELILPSDAVLRDDGTVLVLDGYGGRVLQFDPGGGVITPFSVEPVGRASRLAPAADGGWWVVRPGDGTDPGTLLRLGADGSSAGLIVPRGVDGEPVHPVDVLEVAGVLWVADRAGGIQRLDAQGVVDRWLDLGVQGEPARRLVDLAADGEGFVAVDTLEHRVTAWTKDGEPRVGFGRAGSSLGTFARPTAAAAFPGGLWVADAVLGVVQAFEQDGDLIGAMGEQGTLARFQHPVAVRTNPAVPGRVVVLAASPASLTVWDVEPLPPAQLPALLRTTVAEPIPGFIGAAGEGCVQCHDGLILDSRQVWDPARLHHPVDILPVRPVPEGLPLDDEGRITCRTCHSPHRRSGTAQVAHAAPASPFLRLDAKADALCIACHGEAVHTTAVAGRTPTGPGHPAGPALVRALAARGPGPALQGGTCLSCHATHGATSAPLLREADDTLACAGCHRAKVEPATNHPLGRVPGRDLVSATAGRPIRLDAAGGVGCQTCHGLSEGRPALLRVLENRSAVCLGCHAQGATVGGGAHAALAKRGLPSCVTCHDVHGADRSEHLVAARSPTAADPNGCRSCHADSVVAGRGHPVDAAVPCGACHDPHAANRPDAASCDTCHAEQGAARDAGGHGRATCLSCHPAHGSAPAWRGPENPASASCLGCHDPSTADANTPSVAHREHPSPQFVADGARWKPLAGLLLHGPDGRPVDAGMNGELTCQSCHRVHGPDGSVDHLRHATGWQEACGACHGPDARVLYETFHDPAKRASLLGERK